MDSKKTLLIGAALVIIPVVLLLFWPWLRAAFWAVLFGSIALLVLLAGALFVVMGVVQAREDRAALEQEAREREQQSSMAARPS